MVDNVAGGAMWQKIVEETCEIYEMLGANSHQKSVRGQRAIVNEVLLVENPLASQVAKLMRQVMDDKLDKFIQVSTSNQEQNERRFESLKASMKRLEVHIGQLAESHRRYEPGKLPSQPEQVKAVTVLRSGITIPKVTEPEKL